MQTTVIATLEGERAALERERDTLRTTVDSMRSAQRKVWERARAHKVADAAADVQLKGGGCRFTGRGMKERHTHTCRVNSVFIWEHKSSWSVWCLQLIVCIKSITLIQWQKVTMFI